MHKTRNANSTLILTGAIDVKNNLPFKTSLVDTETRLKQYIDSVEYAIIHYNTVKNIIFCENTEFRCDYSRLYELARKYEKNLEILVFKGDYQKIVKQGKGFGEGEIIKYVLENSVLLKGSSSFVKLTGRLIVTNFDKIIKSTSDELNYFFLPSLFYINKTNFLPSVFFKVNTEFFKTYMEDAYLNVNDTNNYKLEHSYFDRVMHRSPHYFSFYPIIKGQSGSNGTFYNDINFLELQKRIFIFRMSSLFQSYLIK
jgi:hypothetical protein